jgi:hypothetical protein
MTTTEPTPNLASALAAAQGEITDPLRNKSGTIRGRDNYQYAGLDDVLKVARPVLSKHGLALTQAIEVSDEGRPMLRTSLLHVCGQAVSSVYPLDWKGGPQDHGSELTYARRYSLEALLGIAATADDDGGGAQGADDPPPKGRGKGKAKPPAETDEQRAARQAKHHPSWQDDAPAFFVALREAVGDDYNDVADFCEAINRPRPTAMDGEQRRKLVAYIRSDSGKAKLASFRAETGGGA